jgi:flagellum-specific peptidoglycan hydrolase FlgJ
VLLAGGAGVLDGGIEPTVVEAVEQAPLELLASPDPVERRKGAARLTEGGVSGWPDGERRAFLDAIAPLAVSSAAEHCLPASVTIAQAVQESGWGTSEKALELHNLFGMKAREPAEGVPSPTWEVVDGRTTEVVAPFRLYGSWLDSVAEHDARIATDALYAPARAVRHDREAFVGALAPIYATDPMYAERLGALIDTYDLDAFDRVALEAARLRGRCAG